MLNGILNIYIYIHTLVLTYRQPSKNTINMYRKWKQAYNNDAASKDGLKSRNMQG
jgi:hypothetical protein